MRLVVLVGVIGLLAGCGEVAEEAERPVRGLITTVVGASESATERRYPGVLEPQEIVTLSFMVAGRMEDLNLSVGQRVAKGDTLATLDSVQFEVNIRNRLAAVEEAKALLAQDADDEARAAELLRTGAGTKLRLDQAQTDLRASRARLDQAQQALASAREDLEDASLLSPLDGIINSVDGESFQTVAAGTAVASLYDANAYEVSFSVNFAIAERLQVGTPARIHLADDASVILDAIVSEIGERADAVSSFPVTVALQERHPLVRAGIAVEVSFEFSLGGLDGYQIPLTAVINEGQIPDGAGPGRTNELFVYVFDAETSTVKRRRILMAGIRENRLLVVEGLEPGEYVATAGVSFLREGMKVKRLDIGG